MSKYCYKHWHTCKLHKQLQTCIYMYTHESLTLVKPVLACGGSNDQMVSVNKPRFSLSACHLMLSGFLIR